MVAGIADNMLVTTYLSAKCPIFVAPAMDLDMFAHPSTQKNIASLKAIGNTIVEPATGELASGLTGKGRMEEPEIILEKLVGFFESSKPLRGKKFLVTAGPTYEKIDAVRFIGNYSSGKMGYAIAESLAEKGAEVILVSGPVAVTTNNPEIKIIHVESAEEMYNQSVTHFPDCQGAVLCAAVADFTPETKNDKKVKRGKEDWLLKLKPTRDIAAILGKMKTKNQILAGFALETDNEIDNAIAKRQRKNFDFIVLNSLNDKGAGFRSETNKITIIGKDNIPHFFELKTKVEVATDIVDKIKMLVG
jgi:phosphopantothenoylcysteine decarboxylase/phosphopantothenate--cysteine ligase